MDFDDWFQELLDCASDSYGEHIRGLASTSPFMYEDYYEAGKTPLEALEAEWG